MGRFVISGHDDDDSGRHLDDCIIGRRTCRFLLVGVRGKALMEGTSEDDEGNDNEK